MQQRRVSELIAPVFYPVHRDIRQFGHTHYWLAGGRGSAKSSFISLEIVLLLLKNPSIHALVLRKVGNTIKDSVFAQILWALEMLGVQEYFHIKISPIEITYRPTGQKILFRGADDKSKIKSIKLPFGYIGLGWYEELDQFAGAEEIRNINQSIMRGGEKFFIFYSYNPPKSRDNWVNVESAIDRADRCYHHSTYLDVPRAWLGEKFFEEADLLKAHRPNLYAHEYLGEVTGTGGEIFDNLLERKISDDEIATFGQFYYGVDFGFAIDPFSWGKLHFDAKRRILYVVDEIYEEKLSNAKAFRLMKEHGTGHVFADSAEPKSIAELKALGLQIDPVKKGPDSVEYGIKWLQSLNQIVIDKCRTPNAFREFSLYEYERNRDGEFISAFPDKNNHFLDACRYALSNVMRYNAGWGFSNKIRLR